MVPTENGSTAGAKMTHILNYDKMPSGALLRVALLNACLLGGAMGDFAKRPNVIQLLVRCLFSAFRTLLKFKPPECI